jgi:uncharacterized protein (DUF2235 family)
MAKNILIFSDGTGQAGGLRPDQVLSNVYKLYRATRTGPDSPIDPVTQVAFYDPGLGTEPDAERVPLRVLRTLRKIYSAATGTGISTNIVECYEAILRVYEPGDRIYLFGFSRGAYTARCVAGVLQLCGIPTTDGNGGPRPHWGRAVRAIADEAVRSVYEHGAGKERDKFAAEREEKARRFRVRYESGATDDPGESNVSPYFIGVFDTVAALGAKGIKRALLIASLGLFGVALPTWLLSRLGGWPAGATYVGVIAAAIVFDVLKTRLKVIRDFPQPGESRWHLAGWKSGFYDRALDPRVRYARHALAIDEQRADFARVGWGHSHDHGPERSVQEPEWFKQLWFAGCHSDIGGGYPELESRLSDIPLQWMVDEITALRDPVEVDMSKLRLFPSANGIQHCEVASVRDRYPTWWPRAFRYSWKTAVRREAKGAPVHPSVLERLALPWVLQPSGRAPYRPEALEGDERTPP